MNHYKKVLFPIHIFQTNIRENELILDNALDKIEYLYKKENLEVPGGWLTDNLFTTFDSDDINYPYFMKIVYLSSIIVNM